ncbi:hypothetical protein EVAR_44610_1 [Eumeta japonica]|uniref:Uncharacterized protein n=1 Tax=Eumeta variegata TaxID=151549 RepID=A0A4C1XDH4_EUMVA|nr:hypothetical protein EVAR_44610_1 [Eumeta japonica]
MPHRTRVLTVSIFLPDFAHGSARVDTRIDSFISTNHAVHPFCFRFNGSSPIDVDSGINLDSDAAQNIRNANKQQPNVLKTILHISQRRTRTISGQSTFLACCVEIEVGIIVNEDAPGAQSRVTDQKDRIKFDEVLQNDWRDVANYEYTLTGYAHTCTYTKRKSGA